MRLGLVPRPRAWGLLSKEAGTERASELWEPLVVPCPFLAAWDSCVATTGPKGGGALCPPHCGPLAALLCVLCASERDGSGGATAREATAGGTALPRESNGKTPHLCGSEGGAKGRTGTAEEGSPGFRKKA